jgi:hypothetical protein
MYGRQNPTVTQRPERPTSRDDGSIALAMLISLVAMSLSALMVPIVMSQLGTTREHVQRTVALNAAEAGIDVALAQLRVASDPPSNPAIPYSIGDISELPCAPPSAPLTGKVGAGGTARYQVSIRYFAADPRGKDDAWLDDAANFIACAPGGGTPTLPKFAMLRSTGSDWSTGAFTTSTSRFLRATYTFRQSNKNVAGGLIPVFQAAGDIAQMCMDAGSSSPVVGAPLLMRPCATGSLQQMFAYQANLSLVLASTKTTATPLGLCLDAVTQNAGESVLFKPCGATTLPQQQWSINNEANFQGTLNGSLLDGRCFHVRNPGGNSDVILGGCGGGYSNQRTFSPEAAVGAGAADATITTGATTGQMVNFDQFGRCLDVTEFDVNKGFLINWPCKQAPDPTTVGWNQRFTWPANEVAGQIATQNGSTRYCLQSPGSPVKGLYVIVTPCTVGTLLTNLTWTPFGPTASYETSYQIVDGFGNCLQPSDPKEPSPELYANGNKVSKIVIRACDGSTLQKWNAPPNILRPLPLKDIGER